MAILCPFTLPNHTSRCTISNRIRRNIFCNHGTGPNHRTTTNGYTIEHHHSCRHPYIVFDTNTFLYDALFANQQVGLIEPMIFRNKNNVCGD